MTTTWAPRTSTTATRRTIPRRGRRGGNLEVKDGNDDDDEEYMMGILPPLVARRVQHLKCLNTKREMVMEQYMEERAALEM